MKNAMYRSNLFLAFYNWGTVRFTTATKIILVAVTILMGVFLTGYVSGVFTVYILFIHNMNIDIQELKNINIRTKEKVSKH